MVKVLPGNTPDYKDIISSICANLLILIYTYAALSKLGNFSETRRQMLNQPLPDNLTSILSWFIPALELVIAALLFIPKSRKAGFVLSLILLIFFTIYVGMAMLNMFGDIACTCGGLISKLTWPEHLAFNVLLISISITGFFTKRKEAIFN